MKTLSSTLVILLVLVHAVSAQSEVIVEQPGASEHSLFGWSSAIYGNWAFVSSPHKDRGDQQGAGEVVLYHLTNNGWEISQYLEPENTSGIINFGHAVDVYENTAVVSAIGESQKGFFSGTVYIYELIDQQWVKQTKITGSDVNSGYRFGTSLDLKDNLLIVGASMGNGHEPRSGTAYVFEKSDGEWSETARIYAPEGNTGDLFGYSTNIVSADLVAVGAYKADGNQSNTGAVYLYSRSDHGWQYSGKLIAPSGNTKDLFGFSLDSFDDGSIYGTETKVIFAGAPGKLVDSEKEGAVYAFTKQQGSWSLASEISTDDLDINSHFGISLAVNSNGMLYIGASRTSSESNREEGSVFAYSLNFIQDGIEFISQPKLEAESVGEFHHFGATISTYDEIVLVSSPNVTRNGKMNAGLVHFFGEGAVSIDEDDVMIVEEFKLNQNYPNPFNPVTVIAYQLPVNSDVKLEVYDMLGRRVAILVNETVEAGVHEINFNASHLASGVYIYRLQAGEQTFTKKLTLIK